MFYIYLLYHYISQRTLDPIITVDGYCTGRSFIQFDIPHEEIPKKTEKVSSFPIQRNRSSTYHSRDKTLKWVISYDTVKDVSKSYLIIFIGIIILIHKFNVYFEKEIAEWNRSRILKNILEKEHEIDLLKKML